MMTDLVLYKRTGRALVVSRARRGKPEAKGANVRLKGVLTLVELFLEGGEDLVEMVVGEVKAVVVRLNTLWQVGVGRDGSHDDGMLGKSEKELG